MIFSNTKGPEVGRWFLLFNWRRDTFQRGPGWRVFELALIRPHTEPGMGEMWTHGRHYRGVWLAFAYWLPWELIQ